jgi:biopolymer transport protein ExbB/TolQ
MQANLIELFYSISQALLAPLMVSLVVAMMCLVVAMGVTTRMAVERLTIGRGWRSFMEAVRRNKSRAADWKSASRIGMPKWFATRCSQQDDVMALPILLPEAELMASRALGRLQIFIRIGPMLGLIGTLLPLGPALQELSASRLASVGENLNVAFTTTVFGILIGAVAYALHLVQRSWFERDLNDMECILELLKRESNDAS